MDIVNSTKKGDLDDKMLDAFWENLEETEM